jgi:hypothetical protein
MGPRTIATGFAALIAIPALAQARDVTFSDLDGQTVIASFTYSQTIRRIEENRVLTNENRQTVTLKIGPGNRIDQEHRVQIVAPNGREVGVDVATLTAELNRPRKWGHGELVWLFDQGQLVRLQTFDKGGRKITIAFKRGPSGLTCTVEAPFSKEEGAGAITTTAAVGKVKIEILSAKVHSNACRVARTAG